MSGYITFFGVMFLVAGIVPLCLYTFPNPPKLSIEEFSVPAFNKSSDQTAGSIYFNLKLRNMNKAIGVYYDDPFSIAFFYYPYDQPFQKYMWAGSVPSFYQGNGKTKHIRYLMGNNLQLPSTVVVDPEELGNHLQLRSMLSGTQDADQVMAETPQDMVGRTLTVNFKIAVVINYRFKYCRVGSSKHQAELGGNVLVDLNTGKTVSAGSIDLVVSAAPAGGLVMLMLLFLPFLLMM